MTKRPEFSALDVIDRDGIPQSFRFGQRRYVVQRVVMQWIETGPWWLAVNSPELADVDDVTWCIWRVEAQSMSGTIIADVAQRFSLMSACADPWRMIRVLD